MLNEKLRQDVITALIDGMGCTLVSKMSNYNKGAKSEDDAPAETYQELFYPGKGIYLGVSAKLGGIVAVTTFVASESRGKVALINGVVVTPDDYMDKLKMIDELTEDFTQKKGPKAKALREVV